MRLLNRVEMSQVAGSGETKEEEPSGNPPPKDEETIEEMVGEWATMGCIAATKGAAGGIPCDMGGRALTAVLENAANIDAGNAWTCAKIGKNCDRLEGAGR